MSESRTKAEMHARFLASRARMEAGRRLAPVEIPHFLPTRAQATARIPVPIPPPAAAPARSPSPTTMRGHVNPLFVIDHVAKAAGLTVEDITGPSRKRLPVAARQAAMAILRVVRPDLSLLSIGRFFADRDHTTVLHGIRQISAVEVGEESKP